MSLRVDPSLWFKYHAFNGGDVESLEQLCETSRCYYEKVKSETERYSDIKSEHEIKRLAFSRCGNQREWCSDENYRNSAGKCTNYKSSEHRKRYLHFSEFKGNNEAIYQCRFASVNLKRKEVHCLFNSDPNFRIYADTVGKPSCYPYFVVNARPDATRVITLYPIKHCENEEYVQTSDAWQAVLQTLIYMKTELKLDNLPLNRIYVNFGKWMSQRADKQKLLACHAHINIVLNRETIDKINDENQSKDCAWKLFPSLVGSVLLPNAHRLEDAWKLIKYMNDYMTPSWIKRNQKLERRISILEPELKMVKQENQELERRISILEPELKMVKQENQELERRISILEPELKMVKQENQELERRISILEPELKMVKQENQELERRINILEPELKVVKQENQELEKRISILEPELKMVKQENQELERRINILEPELKMVTKQENQELERRISILEPELKMVIKQENKDLKRLMFGTTYNGHEIEESANIIDESDTGRGINDAILMQESEQDSYQRWSRFLFPWNRF
jgi:hypothetical protein